MIRVAVVDNHESVREGVVSRLNSQSGMDVIASCATVAELTTSAVGADVVILDLWLEDGSSHDDIPRLVGDGAAVLLYTSEETAVPLRRAVTLGATGVLLKSDPLDTLVSAVAAAADGEFCCSGPLAHALLTDTQVAKLSSQQVDVLKALADGLAYRKAAQLLGISEGTLKTYLSRTRNSFREIGIEAGNSLDMIRLAREQGHMP